MRLQDIPGVTTSSVVVTIDDLRIPAPDVDVDVVYRVAEIDGDRFALRKADRLITVTGRGLQDTALLRRAAGVLALGCFDKSVGEGSRPLHLWWLDRAYDFGVLRVHVPEDSLIQIASDLGMSEQNVLGWLRDEFLFADPLGGLCAFIRLDPQAAPELPDAVRLVSRANALDIRKSDGVTEVRRLAKGGTNEQGVAVLLGDVDFTTAIGSAAGDGPTQIAMSTQTYLDLWRRYGELEREQIEEMQTRIGPIPYRAIRHDSDGFEVDIAAEGRGQASELLSEVARGRDRVVLTTSSRYQVEPRGQFTIRRGSTEKKLRVTSSYDEEALPPASGYVHLSLAGDKTSAQRREQAVSRIREGQACLPRLPWLLGSGSVIGPRTARGIPPLGPVLKRSFGESVTPAQREAIRVAVTTPDIAIIQGPPGTGKTRVIAALVDALTQVASADQEPRVLVTSEQNEAVAHLEETVQSATGVPPFGVGSPGRGTGAWARQIAQAVESRWADADLARQVIELRSLASVIEDTDPIHAGYGLQLLSRTLSSLPDQVPHGVVEDVRRLQNRIRSHRGSTAGARRRAATADAVAIRAAQRLPQAEQEVADGGWLIATHVLREPTLASLLDDGDRRALDDLAGSEAADQQSRPQIAARVAGVRGRLLSQLLAVPEAPEYNWRQELRTVVRDALAEVEGRLGRQDSAAMVALGFAGALRADIHSAERAHRQLADAFSATNQRSVSREAVRDMGREDSVAFDTVIIDEAARASPLDLLIPMALASRRIILVGDHRQLPQMLEPDVERAIKGELKEENARALDESLFERLLRLVREEDRRSGTTRVVTLDRQFRMHPWLGQFVSDAFYHLDGGLLSPDDASRYEHDDPEFTGLPGVWLDCPGAPEVSRGTSLARESEAARVSSLVHRWLEQFPDLTVGAMSLYAAQTQLILEKLSTLVTSDGLPLVQVADESLQVHPDLQHRLRVGNVDAFQGREFDLVALSLTRSNNKPSPRQAFGFLALPNRLCVAMSRQKRILAVAGDAAFFSTDDAREAVPALHMFLERCRSNDAIR